MIEYIIPLLVFLAVVSIGWGLTAGRKKRDKQIEDRLSAKKETVSSAMEAEMLDESTMTRTLSRVGQTVSAKRPSLTLQQHLAEAGYHSPMATTIYMGAKVVSLVLGLFVFLPITFGPWFGGLLPIRIFLSLCGAFGMFFIPNMAVSWKRHKRCRAIHNSLPDSIDLIEICVSSGMGLEMAWNLVTEQIRPVCTVLADEMALTNLEIHLGATRAEAMRHMAQRTGAQDISQLVAMLSQSERFGTSISEALRVFANTMRERRSMDVQESAEKAGVKLLFPMVMFIFPVLFVITAGPAALRIFKMMANY